MLQSNSYSLMTWADGGGINVLAALIIVSEIMRRIQVAQGLADLPHPCDIFDLICGTGTGG